MEKWAQVYKAEGYGSWIGPLLGQGMESDYIFCLLDGKEFFTGVEADRKQAEERVQEYISYIETAVKSHPEKKYLISDLDVLGEGLFTLRERERLKLLEYRWASELYRLSQSYPNLYVFPLKDLVSNLGRKEAYSSKMWYLASARLSQKAEEKIESAVFQMLEALEGKRKKCLLLDLDNTLWGGVLGEEGREGVQLSESKEGARYKDFQKKIKALKEMGVLLAIVSKNNEADVREMFEGHPDMVLKWEDFAARRINWRPKSGNIEEIQRELNIGLDSMVFIDDNPVEREEIRHELKEVAVPEFPEDSSRMADFMEAVYQDYFLTADVTPEDTGKTKLYQQRRQREEEKKNHSSLENYLKALQTKATVERLKETEITRAVQLVQKTNQFNLTTKRYTEAQLRKMREQKEYDVWIAGVADQFGDNGKTALLIIEKQQKTIKIDSFLMSCRVMGRYLEDSILYAMERHYYSLGYERLLAKYVPTQKNQPAESLYERIGYSLIYDDGKEKNYEFFLTDRKCTGFSKVQWEERDMEAV